MKKKDEIWIGGEDIQARFRMSLKTYFIIFFILFLIYFATLSIIFVGFYKINPIAIFVYVAMLIQKWFGGLPDTTNVFSKWNCIWGYFCNNKACMWGKYSIHYLEKINYFTWYAKFLALKYFKASFFAIIPVLFLYKKIKKIFLKKADEITKEKVIRGRKIVENETEFIKKYPEYSSQKGLLFVANKVKIPQDDCMRHIIILGASGSGKSSLIHRQLEDIRQKNYKTVIVDFKGEFLEKWYKKGDIIFNPFDKRNVGWNIFSDFKKTYQVDSFIKAFIPEKKDDENKEWIEWGRNILKALIEICILENTKTNKALIEKLKLTQKEMWDLFMKYRDNTNVATAIKSLTGPESKQGASVLSMTTNVLAQLNQIDDGDFSFRNWVKQDTNNWIFIENGERQVGLTGLFSGVIDIIASEILSLSEAKGNIRMFFIIDEFGRYNKTESIEKLVTLGRSKGCSLIFANQDLGRIADRYGEKQMHTLFNSLGTLVCMKVNDEYTQNYISKTMGKVEVESIRETHTMSPEDFRDSISFSSEIKERYAVLGSELGMLEKGEMYIRFVNGVLLKHKFTYKKYKSALPESDVYIEKESLILQSKQAETTSKVETSKTKNKPKKIVKKQENIEKNKPRKEETLWEV